MTDHSPVTIWHNPDCGTSRNTLAMIRNAGIQPTLIEYLKDTPSREEVAAAIKAAGLTVREATRQKGTPYAELGLDDPAVTDDQLLDAMMAHPILINSPLRLYGPGRPAVSPFRVGPRHPSGAAERDPSARRMERSSSMSKGSRVR